eukprot:6210955-Pleurochrysis_carterae.AAC.4
MVKNSNQEQHPSPQSYSSCVDRPCHEADFAAKYALIVTFRFIRQAWPIRLIRRIAGPCCVACSVLQSFHFCQKNGKRRTQTCWHFLVPLELKHPTKYVAVEESKALPLTTQLVCPSIEP